MKLTTNKKYVLYYNYLSKSYFYEMTSEVDENIKFWSKRIPIMYSDSFMVIDRTINKLNEQLYN